MQADKDQFSELVEHWQLQQLLEFAKCLQWNCVQERSRCGPVGQYEKKMCARNFQKLHACRVKPVGESQRYKPLANKDHQNLQHHIMRRKTRVVGSYERSYGGSAGWKGCTWTECLRMWGTSSMQAKLKQTGAKNIENDISLLKMKFSWLQSRSSCVRKRLKTHFFHHENLSVRAMNFGLPGGVFEPPKRLYTIAWTAKYDAMQVRWLPINDFERCLMYLNVSKCKVWCTFGAYEMQFNILK